ncbi:MAG: TonB-dependent receptor [Prevotellaceae bacterium]|nr:TonB-dependent receptor [Prevotellaceae bacterium]
MLIGMCSLVSLYAQNGFEPSEAAVFPPDTAGVNFLHQVVVTATRTPRTLKDVPVLTKIIPQTILNDMGAFTVLEALENIVPGLTFLPDANHGDKLLWRGLDNKYVLVLLNGERLVSGRAENVQFARFAVADIDRIEMIDGAASALYGSNAMGAIINIITKEVAAPWDIRLSGRLGRFNAYLADASLGWKNSAWSAKTAFTARGTDGYRITGDNIQNVRQVDPVDTYTLSQTIGFSRPKLRAGLYGSAFLSRLWPQHDATHRQEFNGNAGAFMRWQAAEEHTLHLSVNTDRYDSYSVDNRSGEEAFNSSGAIGSVRLSDVWTPVEYFRLTGGYEGNVESSHAPDRFAPNEDFHRTGDNNLFVQGELNAGSRWDVALAGRLTHHPAWGLRATPKVALMYRAGGFRLRAGVSNGFKIPSLKEMYYAFNMGNVSYIMGNPGLQPETSWYESLSVEYIAAKATFSVTAYYNTIRNKISTVEYTRYPGYTLPVLRYENVSDATVRGIDIAAQTVLHRFTLTAQYALADARDETTDLPFVGTSSRHSFSGSILFRCPGPTIGLRRYPFSLLLSGYAASPRLYNSYENAVIVQRASKPSSVWRAVYTQQFPALWSSFGASLQAGIDNIFNHTDPAVSILPGRSGFIALSFYF